MSLSFRERGKAVIKDYVRSVVLIDDRWPDRKHRVGGETTATEGEQSIGSGGPANQAPSVDSAGTLGDAGADAGGAEVVAAIEPSLVDDAPDEVESDEAVSAELRRQPAAAAHASRSDVIPNELKLLAVEDAVVAQGFIFTGLRYEHERTGFEERARKLALRSDILILDWNLAGKDSGHVAMGLLRQVKERCSGPRFIYVFTTGDNLEEIGSLLLDEFGEQRLAATDSEGAGGAEPAASPKLDFEAGPFCFAIRRKDYPELRGGGHPLDAASFVKPGALLDDALEALVNARRGYLELALMELMTRLSWQLNRFMGHLGRRYDVALLVEHAFDGSLDITDGRGTFFETVFDELRSELSRAAEANDLRMLSSGGIDAFLASLAQRIELPLPSEEVLRAQAARVVNGTDRPSSEATRLMDEYKAELVEAIKEKLQPRMPHGLNLDDLVARGSKWTAPDFPAEMAKWLSSSSALASPPLANHTRDSKQSRKVAHAVLGAIEDQSGAVDPMADALRLQTLLTQRREPPKRLSQGTVVRYNTDGEHYLICITPLCDAHEPSKIGNTFTFVKAEPGNESDLKDKAIDKGAATVITPPASDTPVVLKIQQTPIVSLVVEDHEFRSSDDGFVVIALPGLPGFTGGTSLRLWAVAQLRRDHAFHITSRSLAEAARIGLDHAEFVRGA